jgi:hypothetical protein
MTISTEKPSRRAALGAIASLSALAASRAIAAASGSASPSTASPSHPDAELFALQPEIEAADHQFNLADDAHTLADRSAFAATSPRPIRPDLDELVARGMGITNEEWCERLLKIKDLAKPLTPRAPSPYEEAMRAWETERDRLEAKFEVELAEAGMLEANDNVSDIRDQIAAQRATTIAGLKFKAKYAAEHYPGEPDTDVMASIIDDILEMEPANV